MEPGHDPAPPVGPAPARASGLAVADVSGSEVPVRMEDGRAFALDHGHVVIAAITSCTNTSNPSVMIGAGLLARNAVERGLTSKPWVKTLPGARAPRWSWTTTSARA